MEENEGNVKNDLTCHTNESRLIPSKDNCEPVQSREGRWGWMVVFASFLVHLFIDGIVFSFGIFYLEFLEFYQSGKGETAWVGSLVPGVTLLFGSVAGIMADKYGCRITTVVGALIATVGFVLSIFAPNLYFLYFSFGILTGLGFGLIYLPAVVCVGHYFQNKRAFAVGLATTGSGIGAFIFNPFTKFLIEKYGWRGAILIQAGIILNCAVCGTLFRPIKPLVVAGDNITAVSTKDKYMDNQSTKRHHTKSLCCFDSTADVTNFINKICDFSRLKNAVFILFLVSNVLTSLCNPIPFIFLYDFTVGQGIDEDNAKWLGSIIGITNTCGGAICGILADRPKVNKLFLFSVALIIIGICTTLFPLCSSYSLLVLCSCVFGLFNGVYVPLMSVVLVDILGLELLNSSFGVLLMFKGVANIIGPPVAGWIFDATGSYTVSFVFSGVTIAASGMLLFATPLIRRFRQKKNQADIIEHKQLNMYKS